MEDLLNKLADLERRVADLEAKSSVHAVTHNESVPCSLLSVPPPLPENIAAAKLVDSADEILRSGVKAPPLQHKFEKMQLKKPEAGTVFGILGISFLVLAAVFLLKLTIESGWLTPKRQVLLASFFGLSCLGLPHLVRRLADNYGALLSGAGVTILHLSWFGAYKVHELIDSRTGLVLATAVGTLSILSNARMANAVFILSAVAGTYLSVPLLGFSGDDLKASGFILIWNLSFSLLSYLIKRRDVLLVSSYFAIFTVGVLSLDCLGKPERAWQCLGLQGIQFLIFAAATFAFSVFLRTPLLAQEASALGVLLLAYYGNLYYLLDILTPGGAPWIAAAFSVSVLALYQVAKKLLKREVPSTPVIITFAALSLAHSVFLGITPDAIKPLYALGVAGVLLSHQRNGGGGTNWRWARFVGLGVVAYGALLTFLMDATPGTLLAYNSLYGISTLIVLAFTLIPRASVATLALGFAHIEMLCALYRLSLKLPEGGSLFVSFAWGLYALLILFWAGARKDRSIGQSAVMILMAVCIKAAFYDITATSGMFQILSLLAAGIMLYSCGWIYNRMKQWATPHSPLEQKTDASGES